MSLCVDLGLFLRNSKTKLKLSLTQRAVLFTLAIRIGSNANTWIKQHTLSVELGIDEKNVQDHLNKLKLSKLVIVEKQPSDKRKNQYKFNSVIANYHLMSEDEKKRVHDILGDEYAPKDLSTGSKNKEKKGAKSPRNFGDRGRNHPLNKGRNHPLISSEENATGQQNKGLGEIEKSPKATLYTTNTNKESISSSPFLSTIPEDFFPDEKRREKLIQHASRTKNPEGYLLGQFISVCKKYNVKRKENEWQDEFEKFLQRELPKRVFETAAGQSCRYDGNAIY